MLEQLFHLKVLLNNIISNGQRTAQPASAVLVSMKRPAGPGHIRIGDTTNNDIY